MNTLNILPQAGLTIRHPDGSYLKADGETVPRSAYWLRRLHDGDVVQQATSTPTKKEVNDE
jgi:hypothetical protein